MLDENRRVPKLPNTLPDARGLQLYVPGGNPKTMAYFTIMSNDYDRDGHALSIVSFDTAGLAGALAKIAGTGSKLGTARAEEASHLFFANGLKAHWFSWMSTHPPLEERIRRLDPRGEYVQDLARAGAPEAAGAPVATGAPEAAGAVAGLAAAAAAAPAEPPPERSVSDPQRWVERAGNPEPRHIEYSAALLAAMPFELYSAVHSPEGAQALIYALLLDRRSESARQRQMEHLEEAVPAPVMARLRELLAQVEETPRRLYVPVVDLSLPALRRLSPERYAAFRATVRRLAEADRRIDLFELAVERILLRHLDRHADPRRSDRPHHRTLSGLGLQVSLVLSALAHTGQDDAGRAKAAFDEAAAELADTGARLELIPEWETQPQVVGEALDQLYGATPELRRKLLRAAVRAALSDRQVTAEEAELLRAVADALDCPIPPVLAFGSKCLDRVARLPRLVNVGNLKISSLPNQSVSRTIGSSFTATTFGTSRARRSRVCCSRVGDQDSSACGFKNLKSRSCSASPV